MGLNDYKTVVFFGCSLHLIEALEVFAMFDLHVPEFRFLGVQLSSKVTDGIAPVLIFLLQVFQLLSHCFHL